MYKCWEQYRKNHVTPKIVDQHLHVLVPTRTNNEAPGVSEWIWVLFPLIGLNPGDGLTLMEGSHREENSESKIDKPYRPSVPPGWALMFDNRL